MTRHGTKACDTFQALLPCSLAVQLVSERLLMLICHVNVLRLSLGHGGVPAYFLHISSTLCTIYWKCGCHLHGV